MEKQEIPDEINPFLVAGITLITLGLYFIIWIYSRNKEILPFSKNKDVDPVRGLVLLFILPVLIGTLFFLGSMYIPQTIMIPFYYIIGTFIIFAIVKYLFEFSKLMTQTLKTTPSLWFLPFCCTISGVILVSFQNYYGILFLLTPLLHLPLLQTQVNTFYSNLRYNNEKKHLYN